MYRATSLAVACATALSLTACGGGDTETTIDLPAKYLVWAVDHEGYVNVFADDGESNIERITAPQPKNALGAAMSLGEIHMNAEAGKAFVVIQSGYVNEAGNNIGGGVAVYDIATQNLERIVPLPRPNDNLPSRIVHVYTAPGGNHLWLNDDGPLLDEAAGIDQAAVDADDYVFRLNWNPVDDVDNDGAGRADDTYLNVVAVKVGSGHKKGAFGVDAEGNATVYATHNGGSTAQPVRSVSLIDIATLTNAATIDLGAANPPPNPPHGMAYANGKFYAGITAGTDKAVAIIDAATKAELSAIMAGNETGQIPVAGYTQASADGSYVYTVGWLKNESDRAMSKGYLAVIDTRDDTVVDIVDLGNVAASSMNIAHRMLGTMEMDAIYIAGTNQTYSENGTVHAWPEIDNDVVAVVELENGVPHRHEDGKHHVEHITVGIGGDHRNGNISADGMRGYYPNGGHCEENHHTSLDANCMGIAVVNTQDNSVVKWVLTAGHEPGSIGVVDVSGRNMVFKVERSASVQPAQVANTGGNSHTH